jgi:hypothetical protein
LELLEQAKASNASGQRSVVEGISLDLSILRALEDTKSPIGSQALTAGLMITDWHISAVRFHQLRVLLREYPVDFLNMFRSDAVTVQLDCCSGLPATTATTGHSLVTVPSTLLAYLSELQDLETAFANNVRICRQRDGERGQSIIPNYVEINKAASEGGSDATVVRAQRRAQYFADLFRSARK